MRVHSNSHVHESKRTSGGGGTLSFLDKIVSHEVEENVDRKRQVTLASYNLSSPKSSMASAIA